MGARHPGSSEDALGPGTRSIGRRCHGGRPAKGTEGIGRGLMSGGRPRCRSVAFLAETARPRWPRECKSENEIKVSNALELVLWGIAIEPRASIAGASRTGPRSQRPLCRAQCVVDGGPALCMTHGRAGHHGKGVRPPQTGVRDMSANVPAPRARTCLLYTSPSPRD